MGTNEPKTRLERRVAGSASSDTGSEGSPMSYVSNDHDGLADPEMPLPRL